MTEENFVWECDCGHREFKSYPPQECPKCWKINGFLEVPENSQEEDILDEIEDLE